MLTYNFTQRWYHPFLFVLWALFGTLATILASCNALWVIVEDPPDRQLATAQLVLTACAFAFLGFYEVSQIPNYAPLPQVET